MGTNYYVKAKPDCPCCGREYEPLHIGKSSGGWKFLFAPYPEYGLTSWKDWQKHLAEAGTEIVDEYGQDIDLTQLMELVEAKQKPDALDASNAPQEMWGSSFEGRDRYEVADEDGYRFSTTNDFS